MTDTSKKAAACADSMIDVLLRSLIGADRVVIETKNALGEMDAHYLHAPAVLEDMEKAAAERDALQARVEELEGILDRIDEASNHYAMTTTYSEGTLRYAHKSTRNLARQALKAKENENEGGECDQ